MVSHEYLSIFASGECEGSHCPCLRIYSQIVECMTFIINTVRVWNSVPDSFKHSPNIMGAKQGIKKLLQVIGNLAQKDYLIVCKYRRGPSISAV